MEAGVHREQRPERQILAEDGSVSQLLEGPVPAILQTLVYNFQRVTRRNFLAERSTLEITYSRFVRDIDTNNRETFLTAIISSVRIQELEPEVLLTVIENDPSPDVVTAAVHQYLMLGEARVNNSLSSLNDVLPMMADSRVSNRGRILAALITFGDRRVCAAVRPYQSYLKVDTYKQLSASIRADTLHQCSIDHLLHWLVEAARAARTKPTLHEHIGYLTRALTSLVMQTTGQPVEDTSFNFGSYAFPSFSESITTDYQAVVQKHEPLFTTLASMENEDIDKVIAILRKPVNTKGTRENETRRARSERRNNDRRVVSIAPSIERRQENRRTLERRQAARR